MSICPSSSWSSAACIKLIVNYILVGIESINVVGAAVGTLCCFAVVAILDLFVITADHSRSAPVWTGVFVKPLIASAVHGASAAWACHGLLARCSACSSLDDDAAGHRCGGHRWWRVAGAMPFWSWLCEAISKDDLSLMPKGDKIAKTFAIFS